MQAKTIAANQNKMEMEDLPYCGYPLQQTFWVKKRPQHERTKITVPNTARPREWPVGGTFESEPVYDRLKERLGSIGCRVIRPIFVPSLA